MNSSNMLRYLSLVLIVFVAAAALAVYLVDSITQRSLDSVTQSLLTFVTGVISTLAGVHLGSSSTTSGAQTGATISASATSAATSPTNGGSH